MDNKRLTQLQSWNCVYIFLRSLWEQAPQKFACHGIGLGAYLHFYNSSFKEDYEWRRVFTSTFHHAWTDSDSLSSEDLFTLVVALIAKCKKKYKFDLFVVETVLQNMKQNPHQEEWRLWNEAVHAAFLGKEREWLSDFQLKNGG